MASVVALFILGELDMKLAIIGSRNLHVENFDKYLPENVTEIVSGGAKGIDTDAGNYADANGIKLTVFKPQFNRFRGGATHIRNKEIVNYADEVLAFWDGNSHGTAKVIEYCHETSKKVTVIKMK